MLKILSFSLDKKIADKNSAAAKRMIEYGKLVDKYTILVLADKDEIIELSEKVKVVSVRVANKLLSWFKLKKQAQEILRTDKFNIITVQDAYYIGLLALKLARKDKIGLEVQVHGFEKLYGIRKVIAKHVLPKADAVRVVSRRLKKQLVDEFKVAENRITVVPIYTDISSKTGLPRLPQKRDPRNDSDPFIFLTVCRLVPVKNIEMQIKAMAEVVKKYKNVELWIVGDGPQRKALNVKCQMSNVKCNFVGWSDDINRYYSQADVFLLTSNYEGWGLVAVEAASYSLPIIMTDVGLAGEVIKDGKSGIVIPVNDQKALEEAMVELIKDGGLRKKLGERARKAMEQLPDKKQTLELYKKSWQNAMKNK